MCISSKRDPHQNYQKEQNCEQVTGKKEQQFTSMLLFHASLNAEYLLFISLNFGHTHDIQEM